MGWTAVFDFQQREKICFLLYSIQTGSGAYRDFYRMGTGGSFLGVGLPGHEAGHSPRSSVGFKNSGVVPPLPQYVLAAYALINLVQEIFYFLYASHFSYVYFALISPYNFTNFIIMHQYWFMVYVYFNLLLIYTAS
jgi:hypothetical protein